MRALLGPFAAAVAAATSASPLAAYVGQARLLIVSAPTASDVALRRQDHDLASFSAEMNDRDLVVIHLIGSRGTDTRADRLDASAVRRAVALPPDRFGVVLVGKDGGVKLRRRTPVDVEALFQTIDAMPMRRHEIRARAGGGEP